MYLLLLSILFTVTFASSEIIPTEAHLKYCREEVPFAQLRIHVYNIPQIFPQHYKIAIQDTLQYLMSTVLVRDAYRLKESPNLMLMIETDDSSKNIATATSLDRDPCGSTKAFNRTRELFIADFLHEFMHLMGGFSSDDAPYYFYFGKANTNNELGLVNGHIKQVEENLYVVSPGVLEELHKIDPNLIGAPMESQKRNGVVYPHSHWHATQFLKQIGCDIMLPSAGHEHALSKITVAMINDFGWYQIDYENISKY
jgi:hypothetical protein